MSAAANDRALNVLNLLHDGCRAAPSDIELQALSDLANFWTYDDYVGWYQYVYNYYLALMSSM